ncbi:unnamed protein product [Polarella glacialis]|uniref:Uncharacterized protein n=1 Tax=Polarella glacialis TaxID=89957 RepID=A0A813KJP1_POLGL|nr:unnamed protein product [Polarella glacialis]CAE8706461.1 unnamed protein product [Polarella glacialis]|eukprot:CAMPEP_0115047812 /NCGR_PEP_ID=MMETSP0227-20121206/180_1 /TAXON_ID=89957 /ORGANISM="Polarella glacialis, Strain CCMP 1383" /LENGTH=204 /DNA_ID=CAMNT_0002431085 /DNA_START=76 /DNA_END=690 /DNA_ORIENTATION=+
MEVTVVDTGDVPAGTIISFHTGTIRRHAQIDKDKAIKLSYVGSSEPVRVDLMTQIGSEGFDMVPGQDVYDIIIKPNPILGMNEGVKMKFHVREAPTSVVEKQRDAAEAAFGEDHPLHPGSPSNKLQTALMMRSYLDQHDVLRQMQELLQEMVSVRPEDPIDFMIQKLSEVVRDSHSVDRDLIDGDVAGAVLQVDENKPSAEGAV